MSWALTPSARYQVQDLLNDATFTWEGERVFIELDPSERPAQYLEAIATKLLKSKRQLPPVSRGNSFMDETPIAIDFAGPRLTLSALELGDAPAPELRDRLAEALAAGIVGRRWFGSKSPGIATFEIIEAVRVTAESRLIDAADRFRHWPQRGATRSPWHLPGGAAATRIAQSQPGALWARVQEADSAELAILYDPLGEVDFCRQLWDWFTSQTGPTGSHGTIAARQGAESRALASSIPRSPSVRLLAAEQSNSSIVYDDRWILKLFRRIEQGINPDEELSEYLTAGGFRQSPPFAVLEYRSADHPAWALGILQGFVLNEGDAWQWMLGQLATDARQQDWVTASLPQPSGSLCGLAQTRPPESVSKSMPALISSVHKLGH